MSNSINASLLYLMKSVCCLQQFRMHKSISFRSLKLNQQHLKRDFPKVTIPEEEI